MDSWHRDEHVNAEDGTSETQVVGYKQWFRGGSELILERSRTNRLRQETQEGKAVRIARYLREHHAGVASRLTKGLIENEGVSAIRSTNAEDVVQLVTLARLFRPQGPRRHLRQEAASSEELPQR